MRTLINIAFLLGLCGPVAAQTVLPSDLATVQAQAAAALRRADEALGLIHATHPDATACQAALRAAATSCGVALPCLNAAVNSCRPAAVRFPNYAPRFRQLEGEIVTINARLAANEAATARAQATADAAMVEAKKDDNCDLPPGPAFEACIAQKKAEQKARAEVEKAKWSYRKKGLEVTRQAAVGPGGEDGKGAGVKLPDTFLDRDINFDNEIGSDGSEHMHISIEKPAAANVFYETGLQPPDDDSVAGLFIGGLAGGVVLGAAGCGIGLLVEPGEDTSEFYEDSGCLPGALILGSAGAIGGSIAGYQIGKPAAPAQTAFFAPTRNGWAAGWSGRF